MLKVFITLILIVNIFAKCPDIDVVKDFDLQKYLGKWYEIERFYFPIEENLRCITAEYTPIDSSTVKVNNSGINIKTGEFDEAIGKAITPNPNEPAKLSVSFGPVPGKYWVIDTDYNYSLVYSCTSVLFLDFEYAWILARERTLDEAIVNRLKDKLSSYKIQSSKFKKTDQSNCV